jgi:hypothetical protein
MDDAVVDSHVKREIVNELLKNYINMFQELVVNKYNWHKPISLSNIQTYHFKASLEIS